MTAGKNGLLLALVAVLAAAVLGAGGWWWLNRGDRTSDANAAAEQPLTEALPPSRNAAYTTSQPQESRASNESFDLAASIDDPNGYTNVHSGPSTVSPIVARVSAGETFSTYEQGASWWRVRTEGGLIGYMPRTRIRLSGETARADASAAAQAAEGGEAAEAGGTGSRAAAAPPRRPARRSRVNRSNAANMIAYCRNAGQGTPACRQFARELRGR